MPIQSRPAERRVVEYGPYMQFLVRVWGSEPLCWYPSDTYHFAHSSPKDWPAGVLEHLVGLAHVAGSAGRVEVIQILADTIKKRIIEAQNRVDEEKRLNQPHGNDAETEEERKKKHGATVVNDNNDNTEASERAKSSEPQQSRTILDRKAKRKSDSDEVEPSTSRKKRCTENETAGPVTGANVTPIPVKKEHEDAATATAAFTGLERHPLPSDIHTAMTTLILRHTTPVTSTSTHPPPGTVDPSTTSRPSPPVITPSNSPSPNNNGTDVAATRPPGRLRAGLDAYNNPLLISYDDEEWAGTFLQPYRDTNGNRIGGGGISRGGGVPGEKYHPPPPPPPVVRKPGEPGTIEFAKKVEKLRREKAAAELAAAERGEEERLAAKVEAQDRLLKKLAVENQAKRDEVRPLQVEVHGLKERIRELESKVAEAEAEAGERREKEKARERSREEVRRRVGINNAAAGKARVETLVVEDSETESGSGMTK
ncbi:hypothetical protein UCDDS831_g07228 [Diplodia seriata]|uniref:Uncharacterized protein n=1 Tax=Diplodia seriata TaxID=420778 RepID=A0A0G2E181_9PEZI|nr:hypothetical protein UCDDS831_g07228 [Diplodia seriata]